MAKILKRYMVMAMLLSVAIVISYLESFIPIFVPGVKLGLANVIILIMIYEFKWHEALLVDILRILLVAIIRGTLLNPVLIPSLLKLHSQKLDRSLIPRTEVLRIFRQ